MTELNRGGVDIDGGMMVPVHVGNAVGGRAGVVDNMKSLRWYLGAKSRHSTALPTKDAERPCMWREVAMITFAVASSMKKAPSAEEGQHDMVDRDSRALVGCLMPLTVQFAF